MTEPKNHSHDESSLASKSQRPPVPYWKRAHRSWLFWVALFLMLAAMLIYVMSDDLAGWTNHRPQQPINL